MKADVRHYLTFVAMLVALGACRPQRIDVRESAVRPISMMELHRVGGVPVGWRFTVPPGDAAAGRQAFIDFGCQSCHTVEGEHFPSTPAGESGAGPDLAGMGSHHPAAYFAESILDPNAVLVDGPG